MPLDAGADVNTVTGTGKSPLCQVARARLPQAGAIRRLLLGRGAILRFSDSCATAIVAQDPGILSRIEVSPGEFDALLPFSKLDDQFGPYGASALWQAAYNRNAERTRLLLDLGADVDSRDAKRGVMLLHAAVDRSRNSPDKGRPIISLLLARGSDHDGVVWDGITLAELDDNGLVDQQLAALGQVEQ